MSSLWLRSLWADHHPHRLFVGILRFTTVLSFRGSFRNVETCGALCFGDTNCVGFFYGGSISRPGHPRCRIASYLPPYFTHKLFNVSRDLNNITRRAEGDECTTYIREACYSMYAIRENPDFECEVLPEPEPEPEPEPDTSIDKIYLGYTSFEQPAVASGTEVMYIDRLGGDSSHPLETNPLEPVVSYVPRPLRSGENASTREIGFVTFYQNTFNVLEFVKQTPATPPM